MMKRIFFALTFVVSISAHASNTAYSLFPIAAVFATKSNDSNGVEKSRIDSDFSTAVPGETGGKLFESKFRIAFPDAVATIDNANKRRTFAVSLQIARASKYLVSKPNGTTDVYLPLTGSIYFTNVMTGEVLYTLTRTETKVASLTSNGSAIGSEKIQSLFRENFSELIDSLIRDTQSQFKPSTISATVRGEWKGLAILDKGREHGLGREDTLLDKDGNEILIISSGPSYAIAKVQLGVFKKNVVFSKISNQTLAEIRKPRVLPLVEKSPGDFPDQTLIQLFSDALGSKSGVSLIPVNRTYQAVLNTVASKVNISQEQIRQRELPNLFFRLKVPDPIEYEVPTNLSHKTKRIYEARAIAELVDRSGRILYAGIGRNRIEDEITSGIGFSPAARREVVIKNALIDLAMRFSTEMKFADAEVTVTNVGKEITLKDPSGMLAKGANWRTYRNIGKIEGISSDVRVPTWEISVSDVSADKAIAVLDLPVVEGAPEPATGDVVFLNGVSGDNLITRKRFTSCEAQKLGAVEVPAYGELALNIFAARFKANYFSKGLGDKVNELIRAGSGFKSDFKVENISADYCVEPVYRIDITEQKCVSEACADVATIRLTYRIYSDGPTKEVKVKQGLELKLTTGMLPKATNSSARMSALQDDMVDDLIQLNTSIISTLSKEIY